MTRVIQFKSKVSLKYDCDIWGFLLRRPLPKVNKASKYFTSIDFKIPVLGTDIFSKVTYRLHRKKFKKRNRFYKSIMNRARLSFFLGGLNNRSMHNFCKIVWINKKNIRTFTNGNLLLFEGRMDFILYRFQLVNNIKQAEIFFKNKFIYIENRLASHKAYRIRVGETLKFGNSFLERAFFYKMFLHKYAMSRHICLKIPTYYEVNFRLLKFYMLRAPTLKQHRMPFNINFINAIHYYKTHRN